LRQPEEVLSPDPPQSVRQVTYAGARPWIVPRGPTPADLPSPEEWRIQATLGWEITGELCLSQTANATSIASERASELSPLRLPLGCPTGCQDPTYDGVYRLVGDSDSSHCTNGGRAHLYLGPTGKWYLNSAFSPQDDTCKAVSAHAILPSPRERCILQASSRSDCARVCSSTTGSRAALALMGLESRSGRTHGSSGIGLCGAGTSGRSISNRCARLDVYSLFRMNKAEREAVGRSHFFL
jgi:hypothetical protein